MTNRSAKAAMLIRSSVAEAFDAFANPEKVTQFWLNATSGPLAEGATLTWSFMVPGATETVTVTEFHEPRRIGFEWSDGVKVAIDFQVHGGDGVRVSVEATGFKSDEDGGVEQIVNATEGFSIVLCDLKTLLETGKSAHLVRDKAALIAASLGPSKV
jgi:uncharacterized protein YndB with AHSA1/START domain